MTMIEQRSKAVRGSVLEKVEILKAVQKVRKTEPR